MQWLFWTPAKYKFGCANQCKNQYKNIGVEKNIKSAKQDNLLGTNIFSYEV